MSKAKSAKGTPVSYSQESIGWIINHARKAAPAICTGRIRNIKCELRFMKCRAERIRLAISANPTFSFNSASCS